MTCTIEILTSAACGLLRMTEWFILPRTYSTTRFFISLSFIQNDKQWKSSKEPLPYFSSKGVSYKPHVKNPQMGCTNRTVHLRI